MIKLKKVFLWALLFQSAMTLYGKGSAEGNLDRAIDAQGDYLLRQIPENSILAVIGISSGSENLSKYITEGLTSYIMNNNTTNIKIAERDAIPILQKEIDFQYSGAVDDNFMVSVGKTAGANTVIAGTIYSIGSELRFNVRVIEIETSLVLASNGVDFKADKKIASFLNGGKVEKTLSREKIPVRRSDGSISKANQELRENQRRAVRNTTNFFTKEFPDREFRWLFGYNYFPDFPGAFEFGALRNGLGFYFEIGFGTGLADEFSYIGDIKPVVNMNFGITYPLYFDWLWLAVGGDMCALGIATEYNDYTYTDNYYKSEGKFVVNPSAGVYSSFKRFYMTAKYRYLFYGDNPHSFMLGLGICLGRQW
jgi:TolB-like protein